MINAKCYPLVDKTKVNKRGECSILLRYELNNKFVAKCSLKKKIHLSNWDQKSKKVTGDNNIAYLLNSLIDKKIREFEEFILKRIASDMPVNKEIIEAFAKGGTATDFFNYATNLINNKTLKDGQPYSEDTKRRYTDEIKRIQQYTSELDLSQIKITFLEKYKLWLQNDYEKLYKKKLHKNTIWKALSFIRMVYNEAVKDGYIQRGLSPFAEFKVGEYEQDLSKIKYLELSEMEAIEHVLENEVGETISVAVGWRFLAMCVSGMRISDAMLLEGYFFNANGDLEFIPHKTRRHYNKAVIPVTTERQRRYFQKALSHPLPATNAKSFRTTFNIHLKVLVAKAGIEKNITSHSGRHTMGGFIIDAGIEDRPAMQMLGVKSRKTIETYLHLKESKLKTEAQKMKNVF